MSATAILNAEAQGTQRDAEPSGDHFGAPVAFIANETGHRICKLAPVITGLPFLRKEQPIQISGYVTTCEGPWLKLVAPGGVAEYLVADAVQCYELRQILPGSQIGDLKFQKDASVIRVSNAATLFIRKPQRTGGEW